MNDSQLKKSEELYKILNDIKNRGKLDGVIFAYRDGGPIEGNLENQFDSQKFISMSASVLESAVGIGETLGDRKIRKVIAELEEKTIFIIECDEKTFLILIINRNSNITNVFNDLDENINGLVKLY